MPSVEGVQDDTDSPGPDDADHGLDWGREEGNKQVQQRNYRGALSTYAAALRWATPSDSDSTRAAVHCNMALCHLRLRGYAAVSYTHLTLPTKA